MTVIEALLKRVTTSTYLSEISHNPGNKALLPSIYLIMNQFLSRKAIRALRQTTATAPAPREGGNIISLCPTGVLFSAPVFPPRPPPQRR